MKKQIYNLSQAEIFEKFETRSSGLKRSEYLRRLSEYGYNKIKRQQNWKTLRIITSQFHDALIWILLAAALLAYFFGEERDVLIILVIVLINGSIGFFQEFRAERILEQIRKFSNDRSLVFRDGEKKEINSRLIVPGDILYLSAGDNVPADGYLLEAYAFKVNSFVFTGESRPKEKKSLVSQADDLTLAEIRNLVFAGESIVTGEAKAVVTATGMETELGKIASLTQKVHEEKTPLQKQMIHLGRMVTLLSLAIGTVVIFVGKYLGTSLYESFLFALALAVSVVPEGLPAAISVALSLGMKRLLRGQVLAKKLSAVETLGSVGIICSDKTGTITKNELTVTKLVINGDQLIQVDGVGYEPKGNFYLQDKIVNLGELENLELLLKIGTLCNNSSLTLEKGVHKVIGDPTEGALVVVGQKYNPKENYFRLGEEKITENPFSSERMKMSVVYKNSEAIAYVKGSPDVILEDCRFKKIGDFISPFTAKEKEQMRKIYNSMSDEALRVLALAYRNLEGVPEKNYLVEAERELIWVGLVAMIDPPRNNIQKTIAECRELGIKVVMITGDYEITARAIAKNIGLIRREGDYEVINGRTLNTLSDSAIFRKIKNKDVVFARIEPLQKLRIAALLKRYHQVIAMTGDGVNDAPALKKADIGVAMGIMGTDVSKEAADLILLDDNFSSIVRGVRQGRIIFQNLKKFVYYVFTSNASELFTVVLGILLGLPAPLTAVQILATDLGTDIFPSFSLSFEPEEPGRRKVANARQKIVSGKVFLRIIYVGLIMALGAVAAFWFSMKRGGWEYGAAISKDAWLYVKSTSAAYAVISMTQMANLLQARSEKFSPFQLGFFKNLYAFGAIFISVGLLLIFLYAPFCQRYLHTAPIGYLDWIVVILATLAVFVFEEVRKFVSKRREKISLLAK